jgi:hypothetical protein
VDCGAVGRERRGLVRVEENVEVFKSQNPQKNKNPILLKSKKWDSRSELFYYFRD